MSTAELIDHEDSYTDEAVNALAVATTRQAQEVQAAMIIARRFPRDEIKAVARMKQAAKRKRLAEQSQYEYKRGGQLITGPSIRLAEVMAQNWGNLDYGIIELDRKRGESLAMSYCWDLETNVRQTKIFTVRHIRDKNEGNTQLTSERDIYEHVANYGARRLRACILGIIPGDIQQEMMDECDKTINGANEAPLTDRIRTMVSLFLELSVTTEMLEAKLGHRLDACTPRQLLSLGRIYTSIRDGIADREEHFPLAKFTNSGAAKSKSEQSFETLTNDLTSSLDKSKAAIDAKQNGTKAATNQSTELVKSEHAKTEPVKPESKTAEPTKQPVDSKEDPIESAFQSYRTELLGAEPKQAQSIYMKWFGAESTIEFTPEYEKAAWMLKEDHDAEVGGQESTPPVPEKSSPVADAQADASLTILADYLDRIGRATSRAGLSNIGKQATADKELSKEQAASVVEAANAKIAKLFPVRTEAATA